MTMTDQPLASTDERDRIDAHTHETDQPAVLERSRWRFASAVHAARALNGQGA